MSPSGRHNKAEAFATRYGFTEFKCTYHTRAGPFGFLQTMPILKPLLGGRTIHTNILTY